MRRNTWWRARRNTWRGVAAFAACFAAAYAALLTASLHTRLDSYWFTAERFGGAVALERLGEALVFAAARWRRLGWPRERLIRGLAQVVIGVAALAGGAGYGRRGTGSRLAQFTGGSVALGGLLLCLFGAWLAWAGWVARSRAAAAPAAGGQLAAGRNEAAADRRLAAGRSERAADGWPAAGRNESREPGQGQRHELTVITRSGRITAEALLAVLALAGLAVLAGGIITGATSTPANPRPADAVVSLSVAGAALLAVGVWAVISWHAKRGWLDGTTVTIVLGGRRRSADLAAVNGARLVDAGRQAGTGYRLPVLHLRGGGNLRTVSLTYGMAGRRMLPPDELARLADALAANPLAGQLAPVIAGLRDLAQHPVG